MDVKFTPSVTVMPKVKSRESLMTPEEILYNSFLDIRRRIPQYGYAEMCDFVSNNIITLLSSAVDRKAKPLQIITDREFLIAMDMANISLNREYTNRFNRVYRAYVINPSKNVIYKLECAEILYKIALKLNKKMVNILSGLGLNENVALWIVVNRNSSTDERRNIRRMVRAMQHVAPSVMTEQMVVNIFSKTFNDQFCNLFISVMTDRFDSFESKEESYVYSTVSNAILDILNTMDEEEIKDILMEYEDELRKSGVTGRFSLKSINSGDYQVICEKIKELESMGFKID